MAAIFQELVGAVEHGPTRAAVLQRPHDRDNIEAPFQPGCVGEKILDGALEGFNASLPHGGAIARRGLDREDFGTVVRSLDDLQELSLATADVAKGLATETDEGVDELGDIDLACLDGRNAR